ncbi:Arc family DNA-binding protein [Paracoccus yeei]|uniref:Arc family DNA-binding protein n=1 Tax=Paracoccus yeei TaxID=147645 RepID=UPI00174A2A9D|nr:Arc family DNA-binding protein [Paracoccus yeei]
MKDYPSQTADRFIIRLPDGWRDVMKAEATRNRRSMNAEFVDAIAVAMRIKGVQLESAS